MQVAAHLNAWGRQWPASSYGLPVMSSPTGRPPVTFPSTLLGITVELELGGVWTDISPYVLYEAGVTISRGRSGEQPPGSLSSPSSCRLTLRNDDKRFSPRNINGPYFGLLKRQVRLRVKVNPGSGDRTRFTGFIPVWSPQWTITNDNTVSIEATGILRRLDQGDEPLNSPLSNTISGLGPTAYWPLEEESATTRPVNAVGAVITDSANAAIVWSDDSDLPGSKPLPQLVSTDDTVSPRLDLDPKNTTNSQWSLSMHYRGATSTGVFFYARLFMAYPGPGGAQNGWELNVGQLAGGAEFYAAFDNTDRSHAAGDAFDNQWHHLVLTARQSGGSIVTRLYLDGTVGAFVSSPSTYTLKGLSNIKMLPDAIDFADDITVHGGHIALFNRELSTTEINSIYQAGLGLAGETPEARFLRLCDEAGVDGVVAETYPDTQGMGPQTISRFLDRVREIEAVAEGIVDETFDGELRLNSRTARYSAPVALTLDYGAGQLAPGFRVTDDDYALRNDVTISRSGGATYRAVRLDGPLSADPDTGVGAYTASDTLSLETDLQTGDHAWWRVRQGTVDEQRWPALNFALHRDPSLMDGWLDADIGSRIRMIDVSGDLGTGVDQFVDGYTERFDQFTYDVSVVGSPVSGQNGFSYQDMASRYDCNGSTCAEDLDTTETGIDVTITDNCLWGHDHGDYLIQIGGEQMTVTAVTVAAGSLGAQTQTLTVVRSVNGVVQTHAIGDEVHVAQPAHYAL